MKAMIKQMKNENSCNQINIYMNNYMQMKLIIDRKKKNIEKSFEKP